MFIFRLLVAGVTITVPLTPAFMEPAPTVTVSALNVIVLLLELMVLLPIASVLPAPVLIETAAGPLTLPFKVTFPEFTSATEPLFALALKFTAPVLLRFTLPAPAET